MYSYLQLFSLPITHLLFNRTGYKCIQIVWVYRSQSNTKNQIWFQNLDVLHPMKLLSSTF